MAGGVAVWSTSVVGAGGPMAGDLPMSIPTWLGAGGCMAWSAAVWSAGVVGAGAWMAMGVPVSGTRWVGGGGCVAGGVPMRPTGGVGGGWRVATSVWCGGAMGSVLVCAWVVGGGVSRTTRVEGGG